MPTLGELKSRIANELVRSDTVSVDGQPFLDVGSAITRAIEFYADRRFWFNEGRREITTTIGNEYVTKPAGLRYEDDVFTSQDFGLNNVFFVLSGGASVTDGGAPVVATVGTATTATNTVRYQLYKLDFVTIEDWHSASVTQGQPTNYADWRTQYRIYPVPNGEYKLTVVGVYDEPALAADGSSNHWTTTAADLIVARAKFLLARMPLRDRDVMQLALMEEKEALARLNSETSKRLGVGRIMPSW